MTAEPADDEESPSEPGEDPSETPRRTARRGPTDPRRMVYVLLVLGVAFLAVAAWVYLSRTSTTKTSSPGTSSQACTLGTFPPTQSSGELSLAAAPSVYPPPSNGSRSPEGVHLWVNTTDTLLPGTPAAFSVQPLVGEVASTLGPTAVSVGCALPIPPANWTAKPSSLTLQPTSDQEVNLTGTPVSPYTVVGVFAVQVWVNTTAGSGGGASVLGSFHTELEVG